MSMFAVTLSSFAPGVFVLLLFLPAGTLDYWQGWAFLACSRWCHWSRRCIWAESIRRPSNAACMPGRRPRPAPSRKP